MSFGWSASDIVTIAGLCYKVYQFCQDAPAELHDLADRLDRIGQKLKNFSTVLERSGLGTWRQSQTLELHLLEAKNYVEQLHSAFDKASSAPLQRARGLARLAWTKNRLKRIEHNLDVNEKEIDDMKVDLILICSLRNLSQSGDTRPNVPGSGVTFQPVDETLQLLDGIQQIPNSTSGALRLPENDGLTGDLVAVTNASKALKIAMTLTSQPNVAVPVTGANEISPKKSVQDEQVTKEFVFDIVSIAEETELYTKDADPTRDLEHLVRLTDRASSFREALVQSKNDPEPQAQRHRMALVDGHTSASHDQNIFNTSTSRSAAASTKMRSLDDNQTTTSGSYYSALDYPNVLMSEPREEAPVQTSAIADDDDGDDFSNSGNAPENEKYKQLSTELCDLVHIRLRGRSAASLVRDLKAPMACSFSIKTSESSVLLRIVPDPESASPSDAEAVSGAAPLSPGNEFNRSQSAHPNVYSPMPQAFQHCFESQTRPIPHLIHPDVEGPKEDNIPYSITFTQRQYICVDGAPEGPRWTTSLTYIFQNKLDRATLCETIFGKTLRVSSGIDKIIFDGQEVSHMSALVLWSDEVSRTQSITFSNNTSRRMTPRDVELRVCGLWNAKKILKKSKTLDIAAESMHILDEERISPYETQKQPTVIVGNALFNRRPTAVEQNGLKHQGLRCTIEFTSSIDRAMFLSCLS